MAEVSEGLAEVVSIADLNRMYGDGKWRACERFIVRQGYKLHPCENSRASRKYLTFLTPEKVCLAPPDSLASVGRFFAVEAAKSAWRPSWKMGASGDDEPCAYRGSAAAHPEHTIFLFIDLSVDPRVAGFIKAAIPRGLNFGLSAALLQYSRKPALACALLRRILLVPVFSYVVDFGIPEPCFARGVEDTSAPPGPHRFPQSGQAMLWAVYELLGFRPLKVEKSSPWSPTPDSIGVNTDFSHLHECGEIRMSIKESARQKALAMIEEATQSSSLTPTVAGKLYGKLRWIFCFGRIGLGALRAIKARQYEKGEPEVWALDDEITQALDEFRSLLLAPPFPAVLKCFPSGLPPALVWSDAQWRPEAGRPFGFGQIGLAIKIPQEGGSYRVLFAKDTVPEVVLARLHKLRAQKSFIHPLELIGMLTPYLIPATSQLLAGHFVIHFGDNQAANGVVIKGMSGSLDLNRIVGGFHRGLAASKTSIWIERIRSELNIADLPSRSEKGLCPELLALGAEEVSFDFQALLEKLELGIEDI